MEGSRGSRRSRGSRGSRWSMRLRGSRVSSGLRGRGGRGGAKNQFVFRMSVRKFLELHSSTRFIRKHFYLIPQCCIIHCNIACLALFGKFYLVPLQREWGITPSAGVVRVQILHKYKIKRINSISIYNMWMEHFRIYIETGRLGLVLKVKKKHKCIPFFSFGKVFSSSSTKSFKWRSSLFTVFLGLSPSK